MVRTVPCGSTATPSGAAECPALIGEAARTVATPPDAAIRQPQHEVPVVRLARRPRASSIDAEIAKGGLGRD